MKNEKAGLKYFGTDGFRGRFGEELLPRHASLIGEFLGELFEGGKILIGRDTRESSPMLEEELARGITVGGARAFSVGVITTAAVSYLTVRGGFSAAIMITASHNPHTDNGIKLLGSEGEKLSDEILANVEEYIDTHLDMQCKGRSCDISENADGQQKCAKMQTNIDKVEVKSDDRGTLTQKAQQASRDKSYRSEAEGKADGELYTTAAKTKEEKNESGGIICEPYRQGYEEYKSLLISASDELLGLRIGLDCANGSAYRIAPDVFTCLGAKVSTIGCYPDGENINRGVGSTHIEALRELVISEGLDMGFAFDGDADRCIAVDRGGEVIDGDREILILAREMKSRRALSGNAVAVTVMSNGGLIEALREDKISCEITDVGDKYVFAAMNKSGLSLGGEQSGHVIVKDVLPTGDGVLTALLLSSAAHKSGRSLSEMAHEFSPYAQVSESVSVGDKERIILNEKVLAALESIRAELGDSGRILLRKSGTENLIRVMVECKNERKCKYYVTKMIDSIKKAEAGNE